ncbi:MAG TPA: cytochrome c-type biogenesis protein CcmH [Solirubrobacterales bacterium]|jgi:cytochrome c-type biogenesis protein CcmH|nr:cytochrome c-type biogenesis protein CcmH [Solirubrobacterales bacterium]
MSRLVDFLSLCGTKSTRQRLLWLAPLVLALLLAAPASFAASQASLPDIEDEVMCPICGTLLQLAESPQAQRERAFVRRQIAAGKDKAEVKDALVAEYGRDVLALPEGSGFDLSAYLVPAVAFIVAVLALALGVARWRRGGSGPSSPPTAGPSDEDARRLEDDLAHYDL